ncbi:c-type cytochrome [Ramlibacter sp. AW1]|uniref:C-type cytochrome n=1 Tax=Ramlibacter aurantiacus TaxID=2801330 RepID=A0A936ZR34_9BURK|nr:c-type cytochrome [Ramlibacter aurantiacus]MBL0422146.1 c-type cytochrome [Ramlibacter aurantiacus]
MIKLSTSGPRLAQLLAALALTTSSLALAQTAAPAPAAQAKPTQGATAPAAPTQQAPVSIEAQVAMCIGCHGIPGYQSSFPQVHRVPYISGQNAKYIAAALTAYKNGDRKHPTMRSVAADMSEQDIAAVSAWYEEQAKGKVEAKEPSRQPTAQVAALLQKGACVSCHGSNYSNPIDASYPKLAGQHADYLFVALKSYKAAPGNSQVIGRNNAIMGGIARQFSNAELKAMADYIGSLQGEMQTQPQGRFR